MNLPTKLLPKLFTISLFLSPIALPTLSLLTQASPVMAQKQALSQAELNRAIVKLQTAQLQLTSAEGELIKERERVKSTLNELTRQRDSAFRELQNCTSRGKSQCNKERANYIYFSNAVAKIINGLQVYKNKVATAANSVSQWQGEVTRLQRLVSQGK